MNEWTMDDPGGGGGVGAEDADDVAMESAGGGVGGGEGESSAESGGGETAETDADAEDEAAANEIAAIWTRYCADRRIRAHNQYPDKIRRFVVFLCGLEIGRLEDLPPKRCTAIKRQTFYQSSWTNVNSS